MEISKDYPILEFDATPEAVIEPSRMIKPGQNIPACAVMCFFQDVITQLAQRHTMNVIYHLKSEMGTLPIYELQKDDIRVVVFQPGVGAPLAAGFMEEVIALGCRKFVACGGAGVLDSSIGVGHVVVPTAAVRDEGTSYHYLPPSREVIANPQVVTAIEQVLQRHNVAYLLGKTWTTDALYRETPAKVQLRKSEGCLTVEMEAATFMAVAQFRGVQFGQLLYGGDDLGGTEWDSRQWTHHSVRETLFWLAVESVLSL